MNIQKATKKALTEGKAIAKQNTAFSFIPGYAHGWLIFFNNEKVAMVNNEPAWWNPVPEDFLSDDWVVVDYDKNVIKNAIEGV